MAQIVLSPTEVESLLAIERAICETPCETPEMFALLKQVNRSFCRALPYYVYLQTWHWRDMRRLILQAFGQRCFECDAENVEFHVHHRSYEHLGAEEPGDLILLCANCHAKVHGIAQKGGE